MIIVDNEKVLEYTQTLNDLSKPVPERLSSLWCLRTVGSLEALEACCQAFDAEPKSDLLKHEICFVLGQMNKSPEHIQKAQTFLEKVMEGEHSNVVHHEAMEALGNLNQETTWKYLKEYESKPSEGNIIYDTVFLASKLMEWKKTTDNGKTEGLHKLKQRFTNLDPAPLFNLVDEPKYADVKYLQEMLLDDKNFDLFQRYRALFTLRDIYTEEAVLAICQTLTKENFAHCSPLFKHEVAFVLAQMEGVFKTAIPFLLDCVNNEEEADITKHEVLVCLGEVLDEKDKQLVEPFTKHPVLIVAESAQCALFNIDYRTKIAQE